MTLIRRKYLSSVGKLKDLFLNWYSIIRNGLRSLKCTWGWHLLGGFVKKGHILTQEDTDLYKHYKNLRKQHVE
ncbi:hypothetical protein SUGI_0260970 [Cryptomeria japonica]|nr:hypothetical protein SUGI_0260970 [Cryptomeria japonica]